MLPEPTVTGQTLARGRPLADAVADYRRSPSTLGLHDLLRRFVAACYETAQAHSRGAVHLSLTPRLILLGAFGETAVVGWDRPGPAANGEAAELDAFATAFLAPEQAAGPAEKVGPASDIYALGAILYFLLTGQAPYTGSTPAEVLTRVRDGLAWQPRMVAGGVPAALEGVCLTAMERVPAERYHAAADLAREVERWMAGARVRTNYVEPRLVRLVRWARTRVGLLTLTALSALGLAALAALGGSIYVIHVERAQLDPTREDNRRQQKQLDEATRALHQSKDYVDQVNRQRAAAGEEVAAGVATLQALALLAQPRRDDGPTLTAYKADLLKAIRGGARHMAARADRAGGTDLAAAQDRINLGELFLALGQADEARRHLERAAAITRAAAKAAPDNLMAQRELAFALRSLGQVCLREAQPSLARNLAREAHAAAAVWATSEPTNLLAKREAASCLGLLADACLALHDLPAAREALDQMIGTVEGSAGPEPATLGRRIYLANVYVVRGTVEQLDHRFDEALAWYDRALAILRPLKADGQLKSFPQEAARLDEAEKTAAECRSILQAIADINVALREPPATALRLLVGRAGALARRGRPADAAATAEKMRELQPQDGVNLYNVARCYALCIPAVGTGKAPDALTAEEKAARAGYAAQAVKDLRAAADHGFRDLAKIETDPDLDVLRSDAGYKTFIAELKAIRFGLIFPVLP